MLDLAPLADLGARAAEVVLRAATVRDVVGLAPALPDDYELDPAVPGSSDPRHRAAALVQTVERDLAEWRVDAWRLHLIASLPNGPDVGMQTLEAEAFARDRTVDSASWLVRRARGRGLGRTMRSAVELRGSTMH